MAPRLSTAAHTPSLARRAVRAAWPAPLTPLAQLTPLPLLALLSLCVLPACRADAGWARGRKVTLFEDSELSVRRAAQRLDRETGELWIPWVAARAAPGAPQLLSCELLAFEDLDGDGQPGPGEVRARRESRERAEKVSFAEIRLPDRPRVNVVLRLRTASQALELRWTAAPE